MKDPQKGMVSKAQRQSLFTDNMEADIWEDRRQDHGPYAQRHPFPYKRTKESRLWQTIKMENEFSVCLDGRLD